jgi:hypothetical protein
VLFGSLLAACNRTDLSASLVGVDEAGAARDATATQSTPASMRDATAGQDAGDNADAGSACVDVDVSTYDDSCSTDSDCIAITSGVICPGDWLCVDATINVDGQARYEQTIARLPPIGPNFHCPEVPSPVCVRGQAGEGGVCTFPADNQ